MRYTFHHWHTNAEAFRRPPETLRRSKSSYVSSFAIYIELKTPSFSCPLGQVLESSRCLIADSFGTIRGSSCCFPTSISSTSNTGEQFVHFTGFSSHFSESCQFGFGFELCSYTDKFPRCETPSSFSYVNKSHTLTSQDSPALLASLFRSVESSQVSDPDLRSVLCLLLTWVLPGLVLFFKASFAFTAHPPCPVSFQFK